MYGFGKANTAVMAATKITSNTGYLPEKRGTIESNTHLHFNDSATTIMATGLILFKPIMETQIDMAWFD